MLYCRDCWEVLDCIFNILFSYLVIQKSLFVYLYFGSNVKPEDLQGCLSDLAMKSLNSINLCNPCALWKVKLLRRRLLSLTSSWYRIGDDVIKRHKINRGNFIGNGCLFFKFPYISFRVLIRLKHSLELIAEWVLEQVIHVQRWLLLHYSLNIAVRLSVLIIYQGPILSISNGSEVKFSIPEPQIIYLRDTYLALQLTSKHISVYLFIYFETP